MESPPPGEALKRAADLLSNQDPVLAGLKKERDARYGSGAVENPQRVADANKFYEDVGIKSKEVADTVKYPDLLSNINGPLADGFKKYIDQNIQKISLNLVENPDKLKAEDAIDFEDVSRGLAEELMLAGSAKHDPLDVGVAVAREIGGRMDEIKKQKQEALENSGEAKDSEQGDADNKPRDRYGDYADLSRPDDDDIPEQVVTDDGVNNQGVDQAKSNGWWRRGRDMLSKPFSRNKEPATKDATGVDTQDQEKRNRSIKEVAQAIWDKSGNVKVFGMPLRDMVITGGLGAGTRMITRSALQYLSVGGLGLPALAGGAGGAAVEVFKRRQSEKKKYDSFINERFKQYTEGEFDWQQMSDLIQEHKNISEEANNKTIGKKEREARSDEAKYLRVLIKSREHGNIKERKLRLDEFFKSDGGVKIVQDNKIDAEKFVKQIRSTDLVGLGKYIEAAGWGAAKGEVFGLIGAEVAEWIASGKLAEGLGKLSESEVGKAVKEVKDKSREIILNVPYPKIVRDVAWIARAVIDKLEEVKSGGGIVNEPGMVTGAGDGAGSVGGAGNHIGDNIPDQGAGGAHIPPAEVVHEVTKVPAVEIVKLPSGSNPWEQAQIYGEKMVGRKLTFEEIMKIDKALCKSSDISVPNWEIPGHNLHTELDVGYPLKFDDSVHNVVNEIKESNLSSAKALLPTDTLPKSVEVVTIPTHEIPAGELRYVHPLDKLTNIRSEHVTIDVEPNLDTFYKQAQFDIVNNYYVNPNPTNPQELIEWNKREGIIKKAAEQLARSSHLQQIGLEDKLPSGSKIVRDIPYRNLILSELPFDNSQLLGGIYTMELSAQSNYYNEGARLAGRVLKRIPTSEEATAVARALKRSLRLDIDIYRNFPEDMKMDIDEEVRKVLRVLSGTVAKKKAA